MKATRVVAWVPTDPSVRVMARATAEAAARGAHLHVVSPAPPVPQWSSWRAAAQSLGVTARWTVVADEPQSGGMPASLLAETARACLVVTDAGSLRCGTRASPDCWSLTRQADVYVVAGGDGGVRSRTRDPAVVVGVPDVPDAGDLLAVARREAELRHRPLILVHAQPAALAGREHSLEHRWLGMLAVAGPPTAPPVGTRVVVTRRSVLEALRDHVDSEDVLVLGVHAPDRASEDRLDALLEAPPCDLLLTCTALSVDADSHLRLVGEHLAAGDLV